MKNNIPLKEIIYALAFLLICFLQFKSCKNKKQYEEYVQVYEKKFKENNAKLLDAEHRIFRGDILLTERDNYINILTDSIKHLKKPQIITRVVVRTSIDTLFIPYEVPIHIMPDGSKWLEVPLKFRKSDDWYSIKGTIETHGVKFDSLSFKNDFTIATGKEHYDSWLKNLLKKNNTVIQIQDKNPYSTTLTLQQIVVKEKRRYFTIVAGAGYGINGGVDIGVYGGLPLISF
jgi:hypothetical protein